jgi:hypothetical protein
MFHYAKLVNQGGCLLISEWFCFNYSFERNLALNSFSERLGGGWAWLFWFFCVGLRVGKKPNVPNALAKIFFRALVFFIFFCVVVVSFGRVSACRLCGVVPLPLTVCGLAQAGIFTTKLATKPKAQIYEKLSYEALNPRLCQTAVMGCLSSVGLVQFPMSKVQKSVLQYQHTK